MTSPLTRAHKDAIKALEAGMTDDQVRVTARDMTERAAQLQAMASLWRRRYRMRLRKRQREAE